MSVPDDVPPSSLQAIFSEAVRVEDGPPREAFLDLACGDNNELRERLRLLLRADALALPSPLDDVATCLSPIHERADDFLGDTRANGDLLGVTELRRPVTVGRFRVEKLIGRGGMGNVFLAYDEDLSRHVALKFPQLDTIGHPGLRERFLREARLAAQLSHPNLIAIYEIGVWEESVYIASQWCEGGDLARWMMAHPGPQEPDWSAKLVQAIAQALDHCHRNGVLHLDIKPANIILSSGSAGGSNQDAGELRPLLTDFGVARVIEEGLVTTHSSIVLGTPMYMSPEQAAGDRRNVGPASDIFSLGVVLHELLFGRRPFDGEFPMEVLDRLRNPASLVLPRDTHVPPDLVTICERCLQHEPASRYATADLLADDLGRYLLREPVHARPVTVLDRAISWVRRPQRVVQAGVVAFSIQLVVIFNIVVGNFFCALGVIEENPWEFARQCAPLVIFLHVPSIASALACIRLRPWGVVVGLTLGSLMFIVAGLSLLTGESSLSIYKNNPLAFTLMHLIHFCGFTVQLAAYLVAVPAALRLSRSRPSLTN